MIAKHDLSSPMKTEERKDGSLQIEKSRGREHRKTTEQSLELGKRRFSISSVVRDYDRKKRKLFMDYLVSEDQRPFKEEADTGLENLSKYQVTSSLRVAEESVEESPAARQESDGEADASEEEF